MVFCIIDLIFILFYQEINFQGEGSVLHYGQKLEHCTLDQVWDELKLSCEFSKARKEVDQFNLENRWKKRGISMIPTKFGISFTLKLMNQVWIERHYHSKVCYCLDLVAENED